MSLVSDIIYKLSGFPKYLHSSSATASSDDVINKEAKKHMYVCSEHAAYIIYIRTVHQGHYLSNFQKILTTILSPH